MNLEKIALENAVESTVLIMLSEYAGIFNNHVLWDEYNKLLSGVKPVLTMNEVVHNWKTTLNQALDGKKIFKLSIPYSISNEKYKEELLKVLDKLTSNEEELS